MVSFSKRMYIYVTGQIADLSVSAAKLAATLDLSAKTLKVNLATTAFIKEFTAGEELAAGNLVYVSAANTVMKAATATAGKVIGVAKDAALAAATVEVYVAPSIVTVTADGAITAGDNVTAAATAGRVASKNAKSTGNVYNSGGTVTTPSGVGSAHNHNAILSSVTIDATGYYERILTTGNSGGSLLGVDTDAYVASAQTDYRIVASDESAHTHALTQSAFGTAAAVTETTVSQICGKALTAAAGAGSTLSILLCFAG